MPVAISRSALIRAFVCALAALAAGASLVGCTGSGRPNARFDVQHRPELPLHSYKVFYMPMASRDRTGLTYTQLSHIAGLDILRNAIAHELTARGYRVTSDLHAPDISAYISFGYKLHHHYGCIQVYADRRGEPIIIPAHSYRWRQPQYDKSIWIDVYDWSELKAAKLEYGRVRSSWRGQMDRRFQSADGLRLGEATTMAMNLLADFPSPRPSGMREVYPIAERSKLFPPTPETEPIGPSSAWLTARR
ncbi:MAG: hypothetical protein KF678_15505 [Phycisphaeraceae bacterium]|nr:hypothetical protein [Phycisphaeraceae bacterium]